jgi:hypothetical protein
LHESFSSVAVLKPYLVGDLLNSTCERKPELVLFDGIIKHSFLSVLEAKRIELGGRAKKLKLESPNG